jgi:hypothetical protein
LQFLNTFRCKWTEEDIDIEFTPGYSSTPENESRKHVLSSPMVDRTSLQKIIYDAILIALTRRGFLYLALPITPCALTFPSLETSCKPLRRREPLAGIVIYPEAELSVLVFQVVLFSASHLLVGHD